VVITKIALFKECIDMWNRIEMPEIKQCIYSQQVIDRDTKNIHGKKNSPLINGSC
jgi:hypothetical protein